METKLVGGLLQQCDSNGKPYFTMRLNGKEYLVIPNGFKSEEGDADFLVFDEGMMSLERRINEAEGVIENMKRSGEYDAGKDMVYPMTED